MTRYILALLAFFAAAPLAAAQTAMEAGVTYSFRSETLQEQREYTVSLPASYRSREARRYPTLYVLDGEAHLLHTVGATRHLAASGEIPEMIVVAVASTVRVRDFTQSDWPEAWVGGGGAARFRQFLATELIPHIERQYRTDGFRVLVGHSAGGQFALHVLAASPGMFRGYIALAPSLDWDQRLPARELQEHLRDDAGSPTFLYFAYADDSGAALADDQHLVEVLNESAPVSLRWRFRAYPDETHASLPLPGQIDGLRELYAGYRFHDDRVRTGVAEAEEHFRVVSNRLGWPIPIPETVINALGYAALDDGRHADAIELFERNAVENHDSAGAWDSLAEAYGRAGRARDATDAAARAAEIARNPDYPDHACYVQRAIDQAGPLNGPR